MPKYETWSLDRVEAAYRDAHDEYERARTELKQRVLDLKRARDEKLTALSDNERVAWERLRMPDDAPDAGRADDAR